MLHVVSYSDPKASHREVPGLLDDYAFTALACLDAYEATADLSYFKFARAITDAMIARFYDATSGAFFDSEPCRRWPEPRRAGDAAQAVAGLADAGGKSDGSDRAVETASLHRRFKLWRQSRSRPGRRLQAWRGVWNFRGDLWDRGRASAGKSGAGCGRLPRTGTRRKRTNCMAAAVADFLFNKTVLRFAANQAVEKNLPPVLGATIPHLPTLGLGRSFAVLCSGSVCQPPVFEPVGLGVNWRQQRRKRLPILRGEFDPGN